MTTTTRALSAIVTLLSFLTGGLVLASPLSGSYPNKNGGFGQNTYTFPMNRANVFVFHHFGVEVC
jgi:hypothetical protein